MMALDQARDFQPVAIAVLTISDTRSRDDDKSGDVLAARIVDAGHNLAGRALVADDISAIGQQVMDWCASGGGGCDYYYGGVLG